MGKAKRKINKLRKKMAKQTVKPRIPIAPPTKVISSKKDYNRNKSKKETKKAIENV